MDESRATCAIDISGRPFLRFDAELPPGGTGGFDHELTEEFFRAVANARKLTLHLTVDAGTNAHHMIEARFKAFARALRGAVAIDPTESGVPSTKGTLTDDARTAHRRSSTTGWATAVRSRRRSSARARTAAHRAITMRFVGRTG